MDSDTELKGNADEGDEQEGEKHVVTRGGVRKGVEIGR